MKNGLLRLTILIICLSLLCCQIIGANADNEDMIELAAKSVLKIYVYENVNDKDDEYYATGSGFVAFNSSTLITNYHVIEGMVEVYGVDDDDNVYKLSKVICADSKADIAILEFSEPTSLTPLALYPDDQIKRGSSVIAIGSPKGLKNRASNGIVSYVYDEDGIPWIQITAPISPGSSGGALLNSDGAVIGVTTAGYKTRYESGEDTEAQNLNYAVNIAAAQAMYKAWDGTKYDIGKQKTTAKMDFTGVYDHKQSVTPEATDAPEIIADNPSEPWVCPSCGAENTSKFCLECGAEKPYWICSCGKLNSSNKFCGECGTSYLDLIEQFNNAVEKASQHDYDGAIEVLTKLGLFNSGSFETIAGNHTEALKYIGKTYYEQGIYLQENGGSHADIIQAFTNAGEYGDAKEQINSENARYLKAFYDAGIEHQKNGEFDDAVISFQNAGDYQGAKDQILATYYAKGIKLLEDKEYESCREAFTSAGDYSDAKMMILKSYYEEAETALEEKRYDDAVSLFASAGEYSDAQDRINGVYYVQAEDALENGDTEAAKSFFEKAGEYSDSKDRITKIENDEKDKLYNSALEAFNAGEYDQAYTLFTKLFDYRDAKERAIESQYCSINVEFQKINSDPETMTSVDVKLLINLLPKLDKISDNNNAKQLYKQISYIVAKYNQDISYESAIKYYQQAEDYMDATEQLYICRLKKIEYMIGQGQIAGAIDYYHKYIDPDNTTDYAFIKPGDKGTHVGTVLSLIKPVGIKTKGQIDSEEYKEEYIPYITSLEEHFGLTADGMITIKEYEELDGALYQGVDSSYVSSVLEKLADLSYISALPEKHTKYETKYSNGIKKAEKELGLLSDGIITRSEYDAIMGQVVNAPDRPQNLKVKANKDTVTLTWSKVSGAVRYVIRRNKEIIGTTDKTTWIDKNVETGTTLHYSVEAQKYTANSSFSTTSVSVEKYYVPITVAKLVKELKNYKGKYVKLTSLKVQGWSIETPEGDITKLTSQFYKARHSNGYSVYLLCSSGNDYVEIKLDNYKGWEWDDDNSDLLSKINRLTSISVTGTVLSNTSSWGNIHNIPSVDINHITWNYR